LNCGAFVANNPKFGVPLFRSIACRTKPLAELTAVSFFVSNFPHSVELALAKLRRPSRYRSLQPSNLRAEFGTPEIREFEAKHGLLSEQSRYLFLRVRAAADEGIESWNLESVVG